MQILYRFLSTQESIVQILSQVIEGLHNRIFQLLIAIFRFVNDARQPFKHHNIPLNYFLAPVLQFQDKRLQAVIDLDNVGVSSLQF